MWLYPIFNWFSNDPVGRSIAWGTAVLGVVWGYLTLRDRRVRKEAEQKIELKAEKAKDEIIERHKEEADARLEKAERARDSVDDATTDGMSDEEYEYLFGRERGS
jgi:hypothetical protein